MREVFMATLDLQYLCTTIGNLSGIPIRIFEDGEQLFFYSLTALPRDPMSVYREQIFNVQEHVGYLMTPHFHYYGIVNSGKTKIILGPTRQIPETDQELRELAFRADVPEAETDAFLTAMKSIVRMPFESILQMLCTLNHVLNGEKLTLADIVLYDSELTQLTNSQQRKQAEEKFSLLPDPDAPVTHNTLDLEQTLLRMIRKGDTAALKQWIAAAPAIRGGLLAKEQLRQRKNMFIVTATLVSRAAIQGGMDVDDAFTLSDTYIQQCEQTMTPDAITTLQYRMLLDYTERVERLRLGNRPTKLTLDVANYIQHHMSEAITTEQIAHALYVSRPYLSRKFREETGETLSAFLAKEKTEEAKRLLRYSDKSLTAISSYLGFSSPGHFSRVFRKYTGMAPSEYRNQN